MLRRVGSLVVGGCLIVSGACSDPPTPAEKARKLVGRTFTLTSATEDGHVRTFARPASVSFWVNGVGFGAGCNGSGGDATLDSGHIVFGADLVSTLALCSPSEIMEDERWLSTFMRAQPTWYLDGDRLILSGGGITLQLLDRKIVEPNRPLLGTQWTLERVTIDGRKLVPPPDKFPFATFQSALFRAGTTCNDVSGEVRITSKTILFSAWRIGANPCPEPMATFQQAMHDVFRGLVRYKVKGDVLKLTSPSGDSLEFTEGCCTRRLR